MADAILAKLVLPSLTRAAMPSENSRSAPSNRTPARIALRKRIDSSLSLLSPAPLKISLRAASHSS